MEKEQKSKVKEVKSFPLFPGEEAKWKGYDKAFDRLATNIDESKKKMKRIKDNHERLLNCHDNYSKRSPAFLK